MYLRHAVFLFCMFVLLALMLVLMANIKDKAVHVGFILGCLFIAATKLIPFLFETEFMRRLFGA